MRRGSRRSRVNRMWDHTTRPRFDRPVLMPSDSTDLRSHVPAGLYRKTALFAATAPLWRALSRLESAVLADEIAAHPVRKPIHIAGVPRSGTTLLTEMLARHPSVTSHRYSDFPNLWTPYWHNWLADRVGRDRSEPAERAHRDRLKVNRESPEAVEEVLWMSYFDRLHDPNHDQGLTADTDNPAFERAYRDHIAKLLAVRGAERYLAKGNYNATRLAYLLKLFPDARIVVPWREPVAQVASLVKQDRLFTRMAAEDARVPRQLARSGHFEFGPDKRAVHLGDAAAAAAIMDDWSAGRLAEGWARYWAAIYSHVLDFLAADAGHRASVYVLGYERLCADPEAELDALLTHLELDPAPFAPIRAEYAGRISPPDYYRPEFSDAELERIDELTAPVAARLAAVDAVDRWG